MLVFFKLRPAVITEENLHQSILVSSMLDSPINTLYQAVRQVFAPALLKARLSVCFSVILPQVRILKVKVASVFGFFLG